ITLDALSNALKSRGFRRTPGSPRLITRLRNLKGIEVTRAGIVRLMEGAGPAPAAHRAEEAPRHHVAQLAGMPQIIATNFDRPSAPAAVAIEERGDTDADTEADEDDSSGPGNEAEPGARAEPEQGAEPGAGRRRRRGGGRRRGRRGRGGRRGGRGGRRRRGRRGGGGGSGAPEAGSGPMEASAPQSESA